jgi:alpha-amylase/alpha-mannosidase (GH57 family)
VATKPTGKGCLPLRRDQTVSVTFPRYICIHGHFYQPPRENPWLEAVEVQDSAAPYHDWNERITRECYAPNSRARLVDGEGKIVGLLNNYAWMSYNFGPTLLAWMEQAAPEVLQGIVEGDRLSRERRSGHGNALAQVYNHVIMPLAGQRDKTTEVLWGIADFRKRFGREPEGMWLAETAADLASLEALAAAGIRFTVLAPRQAKRWRPLGSDQWTEVPEGIDPSQAYLCRLPSGKSIVLFFYDGLISRQVAFEKLLDHGEKFLGRLLQGFDDRRQHAQLMHIATDGESYGHHHPHGDMALAYVLDRLSKNSEIRLTNYGEFLDLHPPEWEVEIHENSSWSCVHGVERWRSNCGCNSGRGWQQEWRGPLRVALNELKGRLDELFSAKAAELFPDPWKARDEYSAVILDRSEPSVRQFLASHELRGQKPERTHQALWLLEMQRHGLLMFTSCGWFFDEISGLETTQCLRYAARAIQLARHFGAEFEEPFVAALEKAPSNLPEFRNGRGIWEKLIRPARVDLDRVLAHYAISLIFRAPEEVTQVYCYTVKALDQEVHGRGDSHLAIGRLHVRSQLTWNEAETSFVVIHYGGLDFHAVLRPAHSPEQYQDFKRRLLGTFQTGSLADVTALVLRDFQGASYQLDDLFTEERRRIIGIVLQQRFQDYGESLERLADQDEALLAMLSRLHYPIPRPLKMAASVALDHKVGRELGRLPDGSVVLETLKRLLEQARVWGYEPQEPKALARILETRLHEVVNQIRPGSNLEAITGQACQVLDAAALLSLGLDLWQVQNRVLEGFAMLGQAGADQGELRKTFAPLAARLRISDGLLGWRP